METPRPPRNHEDHEALPQATNVIAKEVVDAAMTVHRALGPGLLESAYELCLGHELELRGLTVQRQRALPVVYGDIRLDAGYRIDLMVQDTVLVEVKAVEALAPIHQAQLLTYLRLSGRRLGFLINFNMVLLKHGLKRTIL